MLQSTFQSKSSWLEKSANIQIAVGILIIVLLILALYGRRIMSLAIIIAVCNMILNMHA